MSETNIPDNGCVVHRKGYDQINVFSVHIKKPVFSVFVQSSLVEYTQTAGSPTAVPIENS